METRPYEHMRNGGSEMLCYGMRTKCRERSQTVPCVNTRRAGMETRPYEHMRNGGSEICAMGCARNVGNGLRPFRVLTHGGRAWKPAPTKHMRNGGSEICAMGCATKCRERSATVPCVNAIRRANNGRPYGTMQG